MATTTRVLDANVNGTVYTSNANDALEALDTCHSGATAPTDEVANGKLWLDTSTTPAILKVYDNAGWNIVYSGRGDLDVAGTMTATTLLGDGSGLTGIIAGMTFALKTANYTAAHLEGVIADTSGGTFTITLPATPSAGDYVVVSDGGDWATTNLTVARNGSTIEGDAEDMTMDIGGVFVTFVYDGVTWQTYTTVGADNSQFATAAQGALADTAVQPNDSPTFAGLTATGAFTSLGIDDNATSTAMTLDASGNFLVGTTDTSHVTNNTAGVVATASGRVSGSRAGVSGQFNRITTDGDIVEFRKDGTTVGSIGNNAASNVLTVYSTIGCGVGFYAAGMAPTDGSGSYADNSKDVGAMSVRWDDIYATNGTIQTSDRNEKEAIASLTPAEMLVAARLSCCFKNFKWKDAVAEKGLDAARMHSGIIAQDVQDAFAAEGLDAMDYAMFISGTWWEHEGTTYHTLEEAPEGATERTRLGVRYPELLAFVAAYNDQRFLTIEARLTALETI